MSTQKLFYSHTSSDSDKPLNPFGFKNRKGFLLNAKSSLSNAAFDICVIGGGITGAAIARDAATRGLSVLLLEKNDFAWGTSSRSSKLVHGGVRYLENFEFKLVFESTKERGLLWKNAPDLCKPIPFLFPAYKTSRLSLNTLSLGLWLYDTLSMFKSPSLHKRISKALCKKIEPALSQQELCGAIKYWDGATDDSLITLANIIDAHNQGATCLSYAKVESIDWAQCDQNQNGLDAHTIHFKDELTGDLHKARARCVVGAVGPWTDYLHQTLNLFNQEKRMAPTRGSHIVVKKDKLPVNNAIVMTHPKDGRVLFAIPWGKHTVIGTTDIFDKSSPDNVQMTTTECEYLIDSCAHFFKEYPLKSTDVISTWTGLRPLLAPSKNASASEVSREHELKWDDRGYLYITGGKLTTHREMAKEAVDQVLQKSLQWNKPLKELVVKCQTANRPFPKLVQIKHAEHHEFPEQQLSPNDLEIIMHMMRSEMILSLEDFFVRRTEIFYKHESNGLKMLSEIKDLFCSELEWTSSDWDKQVERYKSYVHKNVDLPLNRMTKSDPV